MRNGPGPSKIPCRHPFQRSRITSAASGPPPRRPRPSRFIIPRPAKSSRPRRSLPPEKWAAQCVPRPRRSAAGRKRRSISGRRSSSSTRRCWSSTFRKSAGSSPARTARPWRRRRGTCGAASRSWTSRAASPISSRGRRCRKSPPPWTAPAPSSRWAFAPASRRSISRPWCRCGCSRSRSPAAIVSCSSQARRCR